MGIRVICLLSSGCYVLVTMLDTLDSDKGIDTFHHSKCWYRDGNKVLWDNSTEQPSFFTDRKEGFTKEVAYQSKNL